MKRQHNILKNRGQNVSGIYLHDIMIVFLLSAVVTLSGVGFFLPSGNATLGGNIMPSAGGPSLSWNSTWGGPSDEKGEAIAVDGAGNVYVTGDTESWAVGINDGWMGKYSAMGSLIWNITWRDPGRDFPNGIAVDATGNVYVCGYTNSWTGGDWDIWVGKFDSAGNRLWNVTWDAPGIDQSKDLALDGAGNCYVCGITDSWLSGNYQVWVGKFDSMTGNIQWNQTWGGPDTESGEAIAVDAAGKVYITGYTYSWPSRFAGANIWFGKYDSISGNKLENTTWEGSGYDTGKEIAVDDFGNIYIVGNSESWSYGGSDVWLGKYNSVGTLQWNRTWGGKGQDFGYGVALDRECTIYLCGYCLASTEPYGDVWLAKYNAAGEVLSATTWGGSYHDQTFSIALGCNGFAYLAGNTESWGAGMKDILILGWDVQAPISCEEWWAISFLGLPVWGWLVILGEAIVIVGFILSRRKHAPTPRSDRGSK